MKVILSKAILFILLLFGSITLFSQTLTIEDVIYTDVTCYGAEDGMITIVPGNGTLPYEYSIDSASTFQSDSIFESLVPGEYFIAVRDVDTTIHYSTTITITQPTELAIELGSEINACEGYLLIVDDGYDSYAWSNGNNTNSLLIEETGTYTLTVTDGDGGCGFDAINANIYSYPVNTMPELVPYCDDDGVQLTATGGTNYFWSTGENTASILVNPDEDEEFYVTVTNYICYDIDTVTVEIHELFYSELDAPTDVCEGEEFELSVVSYLDSVEIENDVNFLWSFGSIENPATTSINENTTISVISYIGGCSSENIATVETIETPNIDLLDSQSICEGSTATIIASGGDSYLWSTGDETESVTVTPVSDTTFYVTVSLANGCEAYDSTLILIDTVNNAFAGLDMMVCDGDTALLTAFGGDTFTWVFMNDTIGETQSVAVDSVVAGNYIVYVESGSCSDSDTVNIAIQDLPEVNIGDTAYFCEGSFLVLSNETTNIGYEYFWSTEETTEQIFVDETSTISLVVTDMYGCEGLADTVEAIEIEIPVLVIDGETLLCQGESTDLTVSGADNFLWSNGSTDATISITPTSTETYSVFGYNNGCFSEESVEVVYINSPLPTIDLDDNIEACGTTVLDAGGDYESYLWSTADTLNSITVDSSGVYSVMVATSEGCENSATSTVTILELPNVNLGDNLAIDYSSTIVFSISSEYSDVLWSTNSTSNNIVINGSDLGYGLHWLWVTVTGDNGCSITDSVNILVNWPTSANNLNNENNISIYPNPSNGIFHVKFGDNEVTKLYIINSLGQIRYSKLVENNSETIDLKEFDNGIYFIRFEGKSWTTQEKITIFN